MEKKNKIMMLKREETAASVTSLRKEDGMGWPWLRSTAVHRQCQEGLQSSRRNSRVTVGTCGHFLLCVFPQIFN